MTTGDTTTTTTTVTDATATDPSGASDSTTSGLTPHGICTDDAQCGALECRNAHCFGCHSNDECPADLLCWSFSCYAADDLPQCNAIVPPTCGDGIIGALEECDGGPGCTDCRRDEVIEVLIESSPIDALYFAEDDTMLTQSDAFVARWAGDGTPMWSSEVDFRVAWIASDPPGATYLAGSTLTSPPFPRVDAWAPDAMPRWSAQDPEAGMRTMVAVDDMRVLVGGSTEQDNSPSGRAFLAQYDLDGTLAWSRKLTEFSHLGSLVLEGEHATVIGVRNFGPSWWTLTQLDDAGETTWSFELGLDPYAEPSLQGMLGDREGGTWIFGELDHGPWAVHHDGAGTELAVRDCLGATTGRIVGAAAAEDGAIAFAIVVSPGPIAIAERQLWFAVTQGDDVTRGITYDVGDHAWDPIALHWRDDGRLVIGVRNHDRDDETRVLLVEP